MSIAVLRKHTSYFGVKNKILELKNKKRELQLKNQELIEAELKMLKEAMKSGMSSEDILESLD